MKSNRKKEAIFQPVAAPIYTLEDEIADDSLFEPLDDAEKQTDVISRPSLTYWQNAWQKLRRDPLAMAGIVVIILMILLAIFGPLIQPYTYDGQDYSAINQTPNAQHWFGTDKYGRDLFVRVAYGADPIG